MGLEYSPYCFSYCFVHFPIPKCICYLSLVFQEAIGDVHVKGIMYRAVEANIGKIA